MSYICIFAHHLYHNTLIAVKCDIPIKTSDGTGSTISHKMRQVVNILQIIYTTLFRVKTESSHG